MDKTGRALYSVFRSFSFPSINHIIPMGSARPSQSVSGRSGLSYIDNLSLLLFVTSSLRK